MLKRILRVFTFVNLSKKQFNYKILFFGNDDVSLECLKSLYNEKLKNPDLIEKISVLTTPMENRRSAQKSFHTFVDEQKISKKIIYVSKVSYLC